MSGRVKLLVSEAWRSLGANLSTTVAATMTVLIGMFLLGLFIVLGTWTVSWSNHVKRQLVVKVYFYPNATAAQKNAVGQMLEQNAYVKPDGIKYVTKAQGLAIMKKRYPDLVKNLTSNPLGDSLEVTPNRAENVDKLYASSDGTKGQGRRASARRETGLAPDPAGGSRHRRRSSRSRPASCSSPRCS